MKGVSLMEKSASQNEEKIAWQLSTLYQSHGYLQYKMSKFEPYELYAGNKDFLISNNIVTFSDYSGRLMALKPDVTLSIVKNAVEKHISGEKVYYNENVYRTSPSDHKIREIPQMGLEFIGDLDCYGMCEVISLAAESLRLISSENILAVSHMGLLSAILSDTGVSESDQKFLLECISQKNAHSLRHRLTELSVSEETAQSLETLVSLYGPVDETMETLGQIAKSPAAKEAFSELESVFALLQTKPYAQNIVLDFSIVNNMNYYNGITFQGFVKGIPTSVLSGGRYDNLLRKFGNSMNAVGFAVYLDLLDQYNKSPEYDVDVFVLYKHDDDMALLSREVEKLLEKGLCVRVQNTMDPAVKYKKLVKLTERGLEPCE